MILYFSATGNSRHVAEAIATRVGDRAVSIESYKDEQHPCIAVDDGCYLGFICPTYCWGMPSPAVDFLARASFDVPASAYVFTATTFGTTSGQATRFAADLLHEKGVDVGAQFGVQMPDTWTPMFDLSDGARVAAVNARADEWIDKCADMVAGRVKGSHGLRAVPTFAARLYYRFGLPTCEDTSKFTVDAKACVGCGLCARRCPTDAIKMRGGRPVWVKPSCAACLRCLHSCPKFAIQRGHKTRAHGQYRHP
ncbi:MULTISPECIES: EFR1 family ferrodoxin [unclassified Collinsella]|uniref:EFR1 family ferrodoxin n=1 Tax=unclassified Collinsella TaxID=2637548 RepID=UPI00319E6E0F